MKAKKRYTVAEHAFGIFYLAFICAGIWIVSVTRPASLFLVASSCLYIYAKNWKEEWIRGLAPFLGAVTIGFLLVWIAGIFLKFNEPNVDANRILAVEDAILETHETFKSVTHFGWGAYIAVLAILGIVSYYLPRTKLVSRFVTAKRWIESVVIAGTIITSFTFVSDAVVWTPGAEAVQEHFNEAYWRAEHRREDAIAARAALVALVADRQVIVKLTAADFNALREKIGLKLYNPEHPATWRKRVEEEVPMPRSLASFWREMSDKPHTHEQVISARRAARGAEKLVREEEAALASIVEEVARQPKDVLTDIIVDYIVHVSATEFAKLLADKLADAAR